MAPAGHFARRCRPPTGGTVGLTVHIDAAGMERPDFGFQAAAGGRDRRGVVLLHAQITHRETSSAQGPEQLVAVVLERLQPGARRRSHREQASLQLQGAAVAGQLRPGDARPGLPEGRQVAVPAPLLLQGLQAAGHSAGGGLGRGQQHRQVADAAGLQEGGLGHRVRLGRATGWECGNSLGVRQSVAPAGGPDPPMSLLSESCFSSQFMGFFDRLSRLLRANLNDLVSKAEDPGKILDQSVADMQADLVKLRQAVATAIASQKRLQNQAEQASSQDRYWMGKAELALKENREDLAREALTRRKTYSDTATALNTQIASQSGQVDTLKNSLRALEGKIAEAKTKKDMLKARQQAAQAQEQLQNAVGNLGTNSSMAAFDQMEEKVLAMEARSQAAAELAGADLESQFAALEGSNVDEELAALKNRMEGGSNPISLPAANGAVPQLQPVQVAEVDAELEQLKRSIDKL